MPLLKRFRSTLELGVPFGCVEWRWLLCRKLLTLPLIIDVLGEGVSSARELSRFLPGEEGLMACLTLRLR
jgi:hypothetical protein